MPVFDTQVAQCEMITAKKDGKEFSWFWEGQGKFTKGWLDDKQWEPQNMITVEELTKQINNSICKGWKVRGLNKDGEEIINV